MSDASFVAYDKLMGGYALKSGMIPRQAFLIDSTKTLLAPKTLSESSALSSISSCLSDLSFLEIPREQVIEEPLAWIIALKNFTEQLLGLTDRPTGAFSMCESGSTAGTSLSNLVFQERRLEMPQTRPRISSYMWSLRSALRPRRLLTLVLLRCLWHPCEPKALCRGRKRQVRSEKLARCPCKHEKEEHMQCANVANGNRRLNCFTG